jgi:hypothetical protein
MAEWLLDVDPVNRAFNTMDMDGDTIVVRRYWRSEDVQAILDANARQRLDGPQGKDGRHVARIPDIVLYEWLNKFGVRAWDKNHQKKVHELLNSNEFARLRVSGGRL